MRTPRSAAPTALLALALLAGCSGNPPSIARVAAQLVEVNDLSTGRISEELSVFVVPEDKDGLDDLEYLHVISDKAELYWTLDSAMWSQVKSQNEDWVGSPRLAMPDGERFPRGEYRLLLYDLAGDSDEQRFTLDAEALDAADLPFPRVTVAGGRLTVAGSSGSPTLLVFDTADAFVRAFPLPGSGMDIESIRRADSALRGGFRFQVYSYWTRKNVGLLIGPYAVD